MSLKNIIPLLLLVLLIYTYVKYTQPHTDRNSGTNSNYEQYVWEEVEDFKDLTLENLLHRLSDAAIELGNYKFDTTKTGWIGYEPATESMIASTEKRLGVTFPEDYIAFLKITNGLPPVNSIEAGFLPVSRVDYTKNIAPLLIDLWGVKGNPSREIGEKYERSITIAGIGEEQMFFLIPPENESDEWEYWDFASWSPGESVFPSLRVNFENALKFCEDEIQRN